MNIFLAPHNDDEALFGSFIIQRTRPLVIVCFDGNQHERKFQIPVTKRREESIKAAEILRVQVEFFGISDDSPRETAEKELWQKLETFLEQFEPDEIGLVFAPARTGGNEQHDLVSAVVEDAVRTCLFYDTYRKGDFTPQGEMPLWGSSEEIAIKEQALACFESQVTLNRPHFDAVKAQPEYLSFKP